MFNGGPPRMKSFLWVHHDLTITVSGLEPKQAWLPGGQNFNVLQHPCRFRYTKRLTDRVTFYVKHMGLNRKSPNNPLGNAQSTGLCRLISAPLLTTALSWRWQDEALTQSQWKEFHVFLMNNCREWAKIGLPRPFASAIPGVSRLSAYTCVPHKKGNSMGGPPLFNVTIQNRQRCCNGERGTPGSSYAN